MILAVIGVATFIILIFQISETKTDARNQLIEMKTEANTDQRAWVYCEGLHFDTANPGAFIYVIKNIGKTPAINVEIAAFNNVSEPPKHDDHFSPRNKVGNLFPNNETTFFWPSSENFVQVFRTAKIMYFYGTIWYEDIVGNHHLSQFCFDAKLGGTVNLSGFGKHDRTDDNQNK